MYTTKVGDLFIPEKTQYPEGVRFEYTESGPYLIFAYSNPTAEEIQAAKTGKVELALYETDPILWILHKIHGLEQWSDVPFSIRVYDGKRAFDWSEPITDGLGLLLNIILVDANTGILLAQRIVGLPTKFSLELRATILRQLDHQFTKSNYNSAIDNTYRNYTTKDLLQRASIKCKVGEAR